jgi:hypothetical protein
MTPRRSSKLRLQILAATLFLMLAGCSGPGHVQYDGGRCVKDGRALTVEEVEADQAEVARRIASRQPWFAVITIGIVLLAAAGNAEKALMLVRAKHQEGQRPLLERLRDLLARQRDNPALFGAIVGGSLALIVIAGSAYVYLDIDKRASERALAMLQFCHLAMRTKEEEGVLDEQRHNLEAIESTASDIRTLVGKLPPDEQRKAQLIVDQMNGALAKQGKIVGEYVARTDEAQKDLSTHTMAMEKGLVSVEGEIAGLRSLPTDVKELESVARHIDETETSYDARFADLRAHVGALEAKVDALLARPVEQACAPPAASASSKTTTAAGASASARSQALVAAPGGADGGGAAP